MDVEKEKRSSETLGNLTSSRGYPREPWHSTPVKKNLFGNEETPEVSSAKLRDVNRTRLAGYTPQNLSKPLSSISSQDFQTPVNGFEISTMQRQRLELQLLIAELKDRDQELNAMAAAHQKQLLSWEQDRQRVLILEQRCARLEDELQKRNEMIRALSKTTKVVEAREKDAYRELNSTQQQLHELNQTQLNTSRHQQDLEEKNQSLNSTVMMLSSQVGQLQVREEELGTMLRLKDKDMIEATSHILELSGRLCELEKSLDDLRTRENEAQRETVEHKNRFRESRHENTQLKAELREKTMENNRQTEELIRLKQENQLLKKDLSVAELQLLSEDKSWKDELLELSRSKQARGESELLCLRQVCENQQNDLQLLKLNLECVRETLRHHEGQRSLGRTDSGLGASHVIEYSDQQETEIDTGLISSLQNHSTGRNVPSDLTQHPRVEAETQTDFVCDFDRTKNPEVTEQAAVGNGVENNVCAKDTCAVSQGTICEQEMTEKENPARENSCDESGNPTDIQTHRVYCEPGAGLDFVAVIDYDPDTGTPVCVVDVDVSPIFCATDLSRLNLDCPSPLPESGRGPSRLHESALCIEFYGNEEGYSSSTSRLQRLLAESREMVATLENSSGKPVSQAQSPTNTNAVCQPQSNHDNGSRHSQSSTHSQEDSKRSLESDS
ncbi:coiled-coil domain-containing protein 62 isoform X1 [Triplophysa rosa]|uniref:coiled-coil domain-containing protein 62 isoform X1 n=1 Tax=Triplophysa rosa TaxID=992332 RepID=UPI002545C3F2|nr:coiled-coil domain-containing protein 62 isoform X1 [Triplophysa rosa]